MRCRRSIVTVLAAGVLGMATASVSAEAQYPAGVPNLTDPVVQTEFIVVAVSQLDKDPDFPVLVLARVSPGFPQLVLMIVDARNGKETWSLREDSPVFFMLFSDPETVEQAYLDQGFASSGEPSGSFQAAGAEALEELVGTLREVHGRFREAQPELVI